MKVFLLILFCGVALGAQDVCHQPFVQNLKCIIGKVEKDLKSLIAEATPEHKRLINGCFRAKGCPAPDLNRKDVTALLVQDAKWQRRINNLLDFLDNLPKSSVFRSCMARHFKGHVADVVRQCVRNSGVPALADYESQPIPGFEDLKIEELRALFDVRILTRHGLLQCYSCNAGNERKVQETYKCLEQRRSANYGDLCEDRDRCIAQYLKGTRPNGVTVHRTCEERHYAIRDVSCKCMKEDLDSAGLGILSRSRKLKRSVLGLFKYELRDCYKRAGKTFPNREFTEMRKDIRQGILSLGINLHAGKVELEVPDNLKYAFSLAKSLFAEVIEKWTDVLCSDCEFDKRVKKIDIKQIAQDSGQCGAHRPSKTDHSSPEDRRGGGGVWDDWN